MNKKSLKEIFLLFQGDFLEDIVKFTLQNCKKSAKIKQENSGKLQDTTVLPNNTKRSQLNVPLFLYWLFYCPTIF